MFEPLPDEIAHALSVASARLGPYAGVHYRSDVDSTNDLALSLAAAGAAEGTSVLADLQRRGRGRRGHDWFSPAEAGLYLSVVVRPATTDGVLPMLTIGAGVAVAESVRTVSGLPVELKWPNDLVIGRPWRKMGGVLAEAVSVGARMDAVVVGMGINIRRAAYPAELADRVTSIETEIGRAVERATLVVELLAEMRAVLTLIHAGQQPRVADRWRAFARAGLGARVRWQTTQGERHGVAKDIDDQGALVVDVDGVDERIIAGAVTWET